MGSSTAKNRCLIVDDQREIVIFGDSHVNWLGAAYVRLPYAERPTAYLNVAHGRNWYDFQFGSESGSTYMESDNVEGGLPLSVEIRSTNPILFLSAPLHSAPLFSNPCWRSHCPARLASQFPSFAPVSHGAIASWCESHLSKQAEFLAHIVGRGHRVAVVEPPKPLYRTPALHSIPAEIIKATDDIYRSTCLAILDRLSVDVITVPDSTHTNGFTTEKFSASDPTDPHHGNIDFGFAMVSKIIDYFKSV